MIADPRQFIIVVGVLKTFEQHLQRLFAVWYERTPDRALAHTHKPPSTFICHTESHAEIVSHFMYIHILSIIVVMFNLRHLTTFTWCSCNVLASAVHNESNESSGTEWQSARDLFCSMLRITIPIDNWTFCRLNVNSWPPRRLHLCDFARVFHCCCTCALWQHFYIFVKSVQHRTNTTTTTTTIAYLTECPRYLST